MSSYRDMQGSYATLQASREELRQLRERLEIDTDDARGRTTAAQLQLILDSMDRNQIAEESFLRSIVSYNATFTSLQSARGTLLRRENVRIDRVLDADETHPNGALERLQLSEGAQGKEPSASPSPPGKRGKSFRRPPDTATPGPSSSE